MTKGSSARNLTIPKQALANTRMDLPSAHVSKGNHRFAPLALIRVRLSICVARELNALAGHARSR